MSKIKLGLRTKVSLIIFSTLLFFFLILGIVLHWTVKSQTQDTVEKQMLETAQLAWITTVRADGRPHVTPLVPVWLDDAVHFATGRDEQKAVNLARNPHIVVTTGCNTWDRGIDVVVEGEARRITDRAMLERLSAEWGQEEERRVAIRRG